MKIQTLAVTDLRPAARNPNRMAPERYAGLVEALRRAGSLQPILVHEANPDEVPRTFEIIDGHHRVRAHQELGLLFIDAVVVQGWTPAKVEAVRLGLNRARGELDLLVAGHILAELEIDSSEQWLREMSGFSEGETQDLVAALSTPTPDIVAAMSADLQQAQAKADAAAGKVTLELTFPRDADRKLFIKACKTGGAGDVNLGALRLAADWMVEHEVKRKEHNAGKAQRRSSRTQKENK